MGGVDKSVVKVPHEVASFLETCPISKRNNKWPEWGDQLLIDTHNKYSITNIKKAFEKAGVRISRDRISARIRELKLQD